MSGPIKSQVAYSTPFDNSTNGFTAQDVQSAIEELLTAAGGYHAGWYDIIAAQVVTILTRRQMHVSGPLTLTGTLTNNGVLVLF